MDRNSIIGFVLLLLLGAGYVFWSRHEQQQYQAQQAADSLATVQKIDTAMASAAPQKAQAEGDTTPLARQGQADSVNPNAINAFQGQKKSVHLASRLLDLTFSTKGGRIVKANLIHFTTYKGDSLILFNGDINKFSFNIPFNGRTISTGDLYYEPSITTAKDGSQKLTMTADMGQGKKVILYYNLPDSNYMMTGGMRLVGFSRDLSGVQTIPLKWTTQVFQTEKNMTRTGFYTQVHYHQNDGSGHFERLNSSQSDDLDKNIKWFSVRNHFFNSTLMANNTLGKGKFDAVKDEDDSSGILVVNTSTFNIPVANSGGNEYNFGFHWLISPNDYHLLKSYGHGLNNIISLGYGIFFFVKYISKWLIIPLFTFLVDNVASVGVSIILLIFIIRLFLSFFTYKSHLSSAKMKALKPELDKLKEKHGDDQKEMGMEQMKLYRTAGVNPLGGCLPMLFQMPFLLAVYYFIPTSIRLRHVPFLWAPDLSSYDSILSLPFHIPFYGSHVSLFTLLMAATSLFLAVYNQNIMGGGQMAGGNNGQMQKIMKYMPYVMPIMFLGWFNSMAAGLTLYYTCSNFFSMVQQIIIKKYIIKEDVILAKIEANRNQPAKKKTSKWQQRLEEMQKQQQQQMKQRNQR